MRITNVKTHLCFAARCDLLFVEVETNEGITGLGEASVEGKSASVTAVIKEYTRYLIGEALSDRKSLARLLSWRALARRMSRAMRRKDLVMHYRTQKRLTRESSSLVVLQPISRGR